MSFNSLLFIFFLIVVLFLYYLSPHPFRWMVLLISSLVFYAAWDVALLFLMLSVVLINYAAAFLMVRNPSRKKVILIAAALINFGLLFIFKYANFFSRAVGNFSEFPELRIILPMGISFYTFQAMGYTIDVYRDAALREKNFFKFALFITFFPQLVAGPIERFSSLSPQLFSRKKFRTENLVTGLKYLAFGFFKKIVIADRVAAAVNTVYNNPTRHAGLPLIIATVLFAFQIYCDFSGYSDIAVGCAKMLGIDLMQNF
ncbi:MAG: MBOAT family protein, partial [Clostridiales bacterium]|nr:MBOAT family protein [Clostridiales bacterium]